MKIADIAQFVTSKNAGPFLLTVDIVFRDADSYRRFKAQRPLSRAGVAELYGLPHAPPLGLGSRGGNRCLRRPAACADCRV